ncbi:MAG: hypothetical protein LW818_08980 [Ignavibacteriae bacterium]|jgi:hypothetical protein|nr:hypothetical protein [Ignavibacteriota bacterium]
MTQIFLGNVGSLEIVKKLQDKLNGQSWMDMQVNYSIDCNNFPVHISTQDNEVSEEELRRMALFCLALEI